MGPLEKKNGSQDTLVARREMWGVKGNFSQRTALNHRPQTCEGRREKSGQVGMLVKKFGGETEQFWGSKLGIGEMGSDGVKGEIKPTWTQPIRNGDSIFIDEVRWKRRRSSRGDLDQRDDSHFQ